MEAHTGIFDSVVDQANDTFNFTISHEGNRAPACRDRSGRHVSPAGLPHATLRSLRTQNLNFEMDSEAPSRKCVSRDLAPGSHIALTDISSGTQLDDRPGKILESSRWLTQPINGCELAASKTHQHYTVNTVNDDGMRMQHSMMRLEL